MGAIVMDDDEVAAWKWMPLAEVKKDVEANPNNYTVWFVIIFAKFYDHLNIN